MQIQIHARNLSVSDQIQDYVEKKLSRLDKYLPQISEVRVELAHEHMRKGGERAIAQLTVRNGHGTILRAEDKKQADIFAAVDMAVDKMYRQISRYKGKHRRQGGERFAALEPDLAAAEAVPGEEEAVEETGGIVRRKQIDLSPMNEEEAIDQMELLGHDFFVFYNAETGKINILYRREGEGFGLLDPSVE
ncbi:MAG TPA: ribosome-associated translation inhibitor RaiA [Aggregatilineales bacterium]|nr:ribosome-associated translation inhibitor RaiA [Aggregatilineales bacterium]